MERIEAQRLTAYPGIAADVGAQVREARVDHEAFERPLVPCELAVCRATCCHDGVHLSAEEAEGVRWLVAEHAQTLEGFGLTLPAEPVVASGGGWKTAVRAADAGELAADFPGHFPRTRCVLLDRLGRCGLQLLAVTLGEHRWFFKPLTCWIHPLALRPMTRERDRPELTLHSAADDPQQAPGYPGFASCTHCGRHAEGGIPARLVLAEELAALSSLAGRDLGAELAGAPAPFAGGGPPPG
jgi:hypothetical protein